jgi:hypothetical protein
MYHCRFVNVTRVLLCEFNGEHAKRTTITPTYLIMTLVVVVMAMVMMAMMAGWVCGYGGMAMALRMVQGGRIGVTPVRR